MSKEKTLTIEQIREKLKDNAFVCYLDGYPKEDKYIKITLRGAPFNIEKGHDKFFYNGYKTGSQRQLWYVAKNETKYPDLYIEKGFKSFELAIKETLKKYKKELNLKMKDIEALSKNLDFD